MMLSVRDLCKSYDGRQVLHNVNLDATRGEVLALIGPSGSGKSTLLRLMHLLERPTSGGIAFDGADADAPEEKRLAMRRRMAMVFQRPALFQASVFDNVAYGLRIRGIKGQELARRVSHALATVELGGFEKRSVLKLSGGEMQRVALARAMVTRPDLLLLDEPTANLDPNTIRGVEVLLTRIIGELKTAVIMATHDMAQGQRLATRMAVLLDGRILQTGTPLEVFYAPWSRAVADFVGVENVFEGKVVSNDDGIAGIAIAGGMVHAIGDFQAGEEVQAFIRPEEVVLALKAMPTSARNVFWGNVAVIARQGPIAYVTIDCGFPLRALITARSAEDMGLKAGMRVCAFFKVTGMHVVRKQSE
jgi:tungstate transport system ATP-binding protein